MGTTHPPHALIDLEEQARIDVLRSLDILDTPAEVEYDDVAFLAAGLCRTDIGAVNFVDEDRHWTKAIVGVPGGQGASLSADVSFCVATVRSPGHSLLLGDTSGDPDWRDHPLVCAGPRVRFYVGAAILVAGQPVGVVCAFSDQPRTALPQELEGIQVLARQAASHLEIRRRNRSLHVLATSDPLTGLANRTLLEDRLGVALAEQRRYGGDVGVIFGDVDGLKETNDRLGHDAGDRLLQSIAERFRGAVREVDTVARISGDEFVVVCPHLHGRVGLDAVLRRLNGAGVSMGAVLSEAGESPEDVLRRADAAMYAVKVTRGGRRRAA